jgi:hypothetical protein
MSDERGVRIVCTDKGTHPSRELAVLRSDPAPDDPRLLAELRQEHAPDQAEDIYLGEMLGDLLRHDRSGLRRRDHGVPTGGLERRTDVRDHSQDFFVPRWRFRCPTCRRDVQLRHDAAIVLVEKILAAYPETRLPAVDISLLPANLA